MGLGGALFGSGGGIEEHYSELFDLDQRRVQQHSLAPYFDMSGSAEAHMRTAYPNAPLLKDQRGPDYNGLFAAPLSNAENASLSALEQRSSALANGSLPEQQLAMRFLESILQSGHSGFAQGDFMDLDTADKQYNEYFDKAVLNPMREKFEREILPSISASYAPSGLSGSGRNAAVRTASEDFLDAIMQARATGTYENYKAAQDRKLNAARGIDQGKLSGAELAYRGSESVTNQMSRILEDLGVKRETEDEEVKRRYNDFLRKISEPKELAQLMLQFLTLRPHENIFVNDEGSEGLLGGFLSGAGQGTGAALAKYALM